MPHKNIPIFIPHLGCPNQCVFCNQRSISGCREFDERTVAGQIEEALRTVVEGEECEIAFFGGSFTGIDRDLMCRLLDVAERYVRVGRVSSIRLSTRPDYIDREVLSILSRYSVRTVELGLQSMNDRVLDASRRGHTRETAERACRAIKAAGLMLVGQMMIGLPSSTAEDEIATARTICALGCDAARIYPTVVFYDTPLCEMTKAGDYQPLTVDEAVARSASVLEILLAHDVPCIRIGLCATESLTSDEFVLAGPNHPALGELVWNAYYKRKILSVLTSSGLLGGDVILHVPAREVSKAVGQRRVNIEEIERETDTRIRKVVGDSRRGLSVAPYTASKKQ